MRKMAGMLMSGIKSKAESIPRPSPVPSDAHVGAASAREAGIVARRAACFRRLMRAGRRHETGRAGAPNVSGRESAGMKAGETIA